MPWRSIGTITPEYLNWRVTGSAAIGDLVRVKQQWTGEWPGTGSIQVTGYYADGGRYGYAEIWPDHEPRMLVLTPPAELTEAGLFIRYFGARLSSRARLYSGSNWRVTFEEFTPIVGPDDQPIQPVDGGTYDGL